jgi:uncharacterized membrane protein
MHISVTKKTISCTPMEVPLDWTHFAIHGRALNKGCCNAKLGH